MSKAVRKQLFEILDTLQQANNMLEGLFIDASNPVMIDLLADCQNGAIAMGNKIENVYGQGTASVKALEEYCESIYLVSQSLQQPEQCEKYYDDSKTHLKAVAIHMEQEIPDKKEIVFMPYKASMWDSLESVYLAAREDENCEAYVVPIPYFDRKQDKSLGEMHYEGAEYPKNIPVTDWEQYNFEERCPDVIYIHNAYDDMNLVTCVHPRFFSSNLKKYTEELIYIPYFVLEEIEPDDQTKIEGMKHFCVLPGIIHADKVILQSEKMSQIYINEYAKALEAAGVTADREQLKQKFLGLGSPKFDKVVNTKKEDVEVPEEWLKIIQKPDGTWKKIIFYNTSVTALLKHEEKMLTKMKNVFEFFKERQNEVALLWRPHPLIKTTIEAMRPQLWEEYSKIVEQYKAEGWGIYDDTADMDRAIVLSDAYYGDHSSIVQLCQKAGMPVMVQDAFINQKECFRNVRTSLGVRVDDVTWAAVDNFNGIVKMYDDGKIEYVCAFPGYKTWAMHLFGKAVYHKKKLFFLPYNSKDLAIYHIDNSRIEYVNLGRTQIKDIFRYADIYVWKNDIFLFPKCAEEIIKMNLDNFQIVKINGPVNYLKDNNLLYRTIAFMEYSISVNDNIATMFCYNGKTIIEFDMETSKFTVRHNSILKGNSLCGANREKYMFVCDNEKICIFQDNMKKAKWIIRTKCEKEFLAYCEMEEDIIFFPFKGEDLLIVNIRTGENKRVPISFDKKDLYDKDAIKVVSYFRCDEKIIFSCRHGNDTFLYNVHSNNCHNIEFSLSERDESIFISNMYEDFFKSNQSIDEEEIDLNMYLSLLSD